MKNLPDNLYRVDSIVQLEQLAIKQFGIPAYELMKRAGQAVFDVVVSRYSQHKKMLVLCGAGNNAGDGYVVARLARQAGLDVQVISLIDPATLKNEALLAYQDWQSLAENSAMDQSLIDEADIIIDALLGTGLKRDVSAQWADWINAVNKAAKPVIAVDLPSGLIADTGAIAGGAVQADITVCFIGLKQGLFTAQAKDVCGEIIFHDLAVPDEAFARIDADARLIQGVDYTLLPKRKASSNKGNFGHVLIIGGNTGMPGAVILAAKAALRTGAGLVTIVSAASNLEAVITAVPEAMVKACDENTLPDVLNKAFLKKVTHVAIGMGLGQDDWSQAMLHFCASLNKPLLVDADALNLLAKTDDIKIKSALVITPHPGEAARLLSTGTALNSADIQSDRFAAIKQLRQLFDTSESCVVVLKGSGSLIFDGRQIKVCALGNAVMAAPGMGDVLSGIIIALLAQKINTGDAAELGVCLHAAAAQSVSRGKTRGLLASDVINKLPEVLQ
jgi:NAD(P)H-hydrate epimerase